MVVLDTNVLSELVKLRPNTAISERVLSAPEGTFFASEVTRFELRFGALLNPAAERLWARIQILVLPVVSHNVRHFDPVDGLAVEDWFVES